VKFGQVLQAQDYAPVPGTAGELLGRQESVLGECKRDAEQLARVYLVNQARKTGSNEQAVALWRTLQISLSAPWGKPTFTSGR